MAALLDPKTGIARIARISASAAHIPARRNAGTPARDAVCPPFYFAHDSFAADLHRIGFTRRRVLAMGLSDFTAFWKPLDVDKPGTMRDEDAELIFWWAARTGNLNRIHGQPRRDRAALVRLDAALTRLDECRAAVSKADGTTNSALFSDTRHIAIDQELLLTNLLDAVGGRKSQPSSRAARKAFDRTLQESLDWSVADEKSCLSRDGPLYPRECVQIERSYRAGLLVLRTVVYRIPVHWRARTETLLAASLPAPEQRNGT